MRELPPPDDSFWITGRGPVLTYRHNPAQDLWNPEHLVGQTVLIEGALYTIKGVETFRPCISPTNPYGDRSIGLLMRDHSALGLVVA